MSKIKIGLVRTNFLTRWPCTICGGYTEKNLMLAESGDGRVRVCEMCLEAGDIDARLSKHAEEHRAFADYLASLVGQLDIPTFEQWRQAEEAENIEDELRFDREAYEDYCATCECEPLSFLDWKNGQDEKVKANSEMHGADDLPF